jgi:hypothetical protein
MVDKRLLQGSQRPVGSEALDCGDLCAIAHGGERQARIDAPSLKKDGASAALALIAAFLRARQVKMLAQQIKKCRARIERERIRFAIDGQVH